MLRNSVVVSAFVVVLVGGGGCSIYSDGDDAPAELDGGIVEAIDPVAQCRELIEPYAVAVLACSCWDANAGDIREVYATRCERNRTIASPETMRYARITLPLAECVPNEVCIQWPGDHDQGAHILAAMTSWPE